MISEKLHHIQNVRFSPLDLLPEQNLREKILHLILRGVPGGTYGDAGNHLKALRDQLLADSVEDIKVVVFGGGTGLSNIIGGDSRLDSWIQKPFMGLKEIFPKTRAIVCITDNGGSTGELLKDLPIVALGDMRHVLLSSVQLGKLQQRYSVNGRKAAKVASILSEIFNWRYIGSLSRERSDFQQLESLLRKVPKSLGQYLQSLFNYLFHDLRLGSALNRSHCFGNLLLAAAVYREVDQGISNIELSKNKKLFHKALYSGLNSLAIAIGAEERAVLPCTSTPAQLRVLYTNGVEVIGEHKLTEARRGFPVASVEVDYCDTVQVYEQSLQDINEADIIILAPGSLYSSIIPVFKVPGLAEAVRNNKNALKVLVSNLWVQAGETDLSIADPDRKFHVSDMIRAYEKNIPGGTEGLFNEVLCLSLKDIPASVLQRYAVEGKVPIFLDKDKLAALNYHPVECGVYSHDALAERGVIQHDPDTLALAIKGLYSGRDFFDGLEERKEGQGRSPGVSAPVAAGRSKQPFQQYLGIDNRLKMLPVIFIGGEKLIEEDALRGKIRNILFDHPVIPLNHLDYIAGIHCVDREHWNRDQQWDNVFSFFDPEDKCIKIRADQVMSRPSLEVALLIALGESLLGDYAEKKVMKKVEVDQLDLGRVYHLHLKTEKERSCFLSSDQLSAFLLLSRMCVVKSGSHYTRLVNKNEGFTPPGLLMGLMYAWYIDNRFATHIEYKMSIMKINQTDLIPEQMNMVKRRRKMIEFFKEVIFR